MKLLTIIYDTAIDETLTELLQSLAVPGWTKVPGLPGRGGRGPKLNNPVFPGTSSILLISLPDEDVERVRHAIRRLQASFRLKPGVTILAQDVEELA
ncbi:MAG: hypothetical protein HY320_13035 [Armatimonadetes bacterium]|nr:hypothetical protein [Armatimonadota bacterium]